MVWLLNIELVELVQWPTHFLGLDEVCLMDQDLDGPASHFILWEVGVELFSVSILQVFNVVPWVINRIQPICITFVAKPTLLYLWIACKHHSLSFTTIPLWLYKVFMNWWWFVKNTVNIQKSPSNFDYRLFYFFIYWPKLWPVGMRIWCGLQ